MVNKNIFKNTVSVPATDTVNAAGGVAYKKSAKHALAQVATTGTFNGTFYESGQNVHDNLKRIIDDLKENPEYIAKTALYARNNAHMKDMPAYLLVSLADLDKNLFKKLFPHIVDNGRMLRNLVQIARSGQMGRKHNLSASMYRKAIGKWFESKSIAAIFKASIGNDPTLKDIIKMARPKPSDEQRAVFYRYLIGKEVNVEELPEPVRSYELYKQGKITEVPNVDFRMLTSLNLNTKGWESIARNANWTMTRMNLATFNRHGVFNSKEMVDLVANRLRNKELIHQAKVFPYQLFVAFKQTQGISPKITAALQDAVDVSLENVPQLSENTLIAVDISGSMHSPVTGYRGSGTTSVLCSEVAALIASSFLRKNEEIKVMPFSDRLYLDFMLNPRDTVFTNTLKISQLPSGGTNCSLVLKYALDNNVKVDNIILISDNESWLDNRYFYGRKGTATQEAWQELKRKNKNAKLICIDLTPTADTPVKSYTDVLQLGGFDDSVFETIAEFLSSETKPVQNVEFWVNEIEKISLDNL